MTAGSEDIDSSGLLVCFTGVGVLHWRHESVLPFLNIFCRVGNAKR